MSQDIKMPWKSKAQAAWGHSPAGEKALGGSAKVAEWDAATPKGSNMPARALKAPMKGKPSMGGKGWKR